MFRSIPWIDRFFDFFSLPKLFFELVRSKRCHRSKLRTAADLLILFFGYRTFPDNYGPCHLWEVHRSEWKYYYGSNYRSYQRSRLVRQVQPRAYQILFDDKAICERLCRDIVNIPFSYGQIRPDQDYAKKIQSWIEKSASGVLFIKPLRGAGGRDIVLAKRSDSGAFIQNKGAKIPLNEFRLSEDAIVQEYVKQDYRMAAFSPSSVNTVRIVTMLTLNDEAIILTSIMRTGVGDSYVDNWSAGGVGIGLDRGSGQLNKYGYDKKGNKYLFHPTSGKEFGNFLVPEWNHLVDVAKKVQYSFPCYRLLGMDLALEDNAEPVLIEVNDCPDLLGMEQMSGPLLRDGQNLCAFGQYGLLINKHQLKLYNDLCHGQRTQ
jgi:hypothetical protein